MESVINKLAEIETAATKIMQAAENQKKLQDEQQEERIAKFDADLEAETAKRIEEITTKLHSTTDADQKKQRDSAAELLSSLDAYYEQNHGTLEFKTDNKDLFDFSLEEMKNAEGWELTAFTYDLHHDVVLSEGNVMTEYEEKFSSIGNPICKMEARFL
jgi:tRNA (guanine-N7-)-methyltransferase